MNTSEERPFLINCNQIFDLKLSKISYKIVVMCFRFKEK